MKLELTHKNLCPLAVGWLKRPASKGGPGCQVAFSEARGTWTGEIPDALGFRANVHDESSTLVEVKVTRSDFLADIKKPHRQNAALGVGVYRCFMCPENLIAIDELPVGWGLIEVTPRGALRVRAGRVLQGYRDVDVWQNTRNIEREWTMLACVLNRVGDVERVQGWLKDSRNINARLVKENEKLRLDNQRMSQELYQLKHGSDVPILVARRKQEVEAA